MTALHSYDSGRPPRLIELWLDNAPMLFLIIAALTFIIGLNLFAYLSSQVRMSAIPRDSPSVDRKQARYVSLSTNAITGAHTLCLFIVTAWFIFRLKHSIGVIVRRELVILMFIISLPISVPVLWYLCELRSVRSMHYLRNIYWYVLFQDLLTLGVDVDTLGRLGSTKRSL